MVVEVVGGLLVLLVEVLVVDGSQVEGVCILEENNRVSIGNHQDSHGHDTMFEKI